MKKLLTIIGTSAYFLIASTAFAQVPQKFNYQGIARDLKGNPMSKQQMALKLSVLPTADATVPEYEETQLVTTNEFGLYTLQIGNGTAITGDMKSVKWETGNKYIKVAIDAKGGSNYVDAGTTQLLSVPYALYADKAGTSIKSDKETRTGAVSSNAAHVAGDANYVTKFTSFNTIGRSLIFDNGANIGIGTTTPLSTGRLHITSAAGTQPLILESPQGVHNLVRENGVNRGYFGSFIGSGAAQGYPTPTGTSNEDFDIGTSGASTGKLHLATNTTPRVTIMPTTGNVGIGTTTPTARLDVSGNSRFIGTNSANFLNDVSIGGTSPLNGMSIKASSGNKGAGIAFIDGSSTNFNGGIFYSSTGSFLNGNLIISTDDGLNTGDISINKATKNVGIGLYNAPAKLSVAGGAWDLATQTGDVHIGDNSYNLRMGVATGGGGAGHATIAATTMTSIGSGSTYPNLRTLNVGGGNVGIGTITPTQTLHVVSNDTAGLFQASNASAGSSIQGIVRAEYTGSATSNDHVGVSGIVTNTNAGWGIGVLGQGNYYGVRAIGSTSGIGVYATANSGPGVSASSTSGDAMQSYAYGTGAYGLNANSYGIQSTGVYSFADSIGTQSRGRFTAAYNVADNGSTGATTAYSYGSYNTGLSANYRSYGTYSEAFNANNGWNTYGIYAKATGTSAGGDYAGYFEGDIYATTGTFGTKPFTIDHPLDPANKVLRHSSIESNDMMNLYNGNIVTDANGYATVTMPSYFDALNENFKYQLTVIGTFAQAIIKEEMANSQFVIQTNQPNVKVSWQVAGVRHDAVAKKFPIVVEEAKTGENIGHYYEPTAYGVSEKLGIGYTEKINQKDAQDARQKREAERKAIEKMHEEANK